MCISGKFGIAGIIIGAVSVVASMTSSILLNRKINKVGDVLSLGIDQIVNDMPIDVPKAVINNAISIVVDREVRNAVKQTTEEARGMLRRDIHDRVEFQIKEEYSSIRTSVTDEVAKQVANIDMAPLKREVRERAKTMIIDKFDDNLESMLEDFNKNLSNMKKIYESIADTMGPKKDTVVRIGGI
jgi:hypothetical protein